MAGPWEQYASPTPAGPWSAYGSAPTAPKKVNSGSILPFSKDEKGDVSFDSDAGLFGMFKRVATGPGDALAGKFDAQSDEGIGRAAEMAATVSPMSAALRAGARVIPGLGKNYRQTVPAAPTAEALQAAARQGYKEAGASGVEYSPSSVKAMADDIRNFLDAEGYIAEGKAKDVHTLLGRLLNPPDGAVAVNLNALDTLRKRLGDLADPTDKTLSSAATIAIRRVDKFLEATDPSSVVTRRASAKGNELTPQGFDFAPRDRAFSQDAARSASDAIVEARGNAAARFRSDRVTGLEESAVRRADATASGQNVGNTIRQRIASLLDSDKKTRGLSPQELAAAEKIAEGTGAANTARYIGNLFGGGGGMGQAITGAGAVGIGAAAGGVEGALVGAALPVVGASSRALANALTKRQLRKLDELIRTRSPLYETMKKNAPLETDIPEKSAALARALAASAADSETNRRRPLVIGITADDVTKATR